MTIKCVYKADDSLETKEINPMMMEIFLKDLPLLEESALVMKDEDIAYYNIGNKIVGAIVSENKEFAIKTLKWMEKQSKDFVPEYYMLEILNGGDSIYINVDSHGNMVYENFERDCETSPENIKKLIEKSLSSNVNSEINKVLYLAGVNQ